MTHVNLGSHFKYGGPLSKGHGGFDVPAGSSRRTQAETNCWGTRETDAKQFKTLNSFRNMDKELLDHHRSKQLACSKERYSSLNKMESHIGRHQSPGKILEIKPKPNGMYGSTGLLNPY